MRKLFAGIVLATTSLVCLQACTEHHELNQKVDLIIGGGKVNYNGMVYISPSVAKNGEKVTLSIKSLKFSLDGIEIDISHSSTVNGKNGIKSILYYIDGDSVASSSDMTSYYSTDYTIKDLAPGEYSVSAHCQALEGYEIKESIGVAKLTVE